MKVEVNRNDEMPKAGDLVIDELGNYTDSDKLYKFEGTATLSND